MSGKYTGPRVERPSSWDLIRDVDWARLAAFLDGEGCIRIQQYRVGYISARSTKQRHQLRLSITNTDARLPVWVRDLLGFGHIVVRYRYEKHRAPCYDFVIQGRRAGHVLQSCLPYFVIKREQADIALQFHELGYCKRGHGGRLTEEFVEQREILHRQLKDAKNRMRPMEAINAIVPR